VQKKLISEHYSNRFSLCLQEVEAPRSLLNRWINCWTSSCPLWSRVVFCAGVQRWTAQCSPQPLDFIVKVQRCSMFNGCALVTTEHGLCDQILGTGCV